MRDQSCPECNRLWREYALATNEDIKVDGQRKLALLRYDAGLSEQLTSQSETTAEKRESLRQQINEHEATHKPFIRSAAE